MDSQHTSTVSAGPCCQLGCMVEYISSSYPGGTEKAELAKSHPDVHERLWELLDELAAEQRGRQFIQQITVWRSLENRHSGGSYISELYQKGVCIGGGAKQIIERHSFFRDKTIPNLGPIKLVLISPSDVGFQRDVSREEFINRVLNLGGSRIAVCPCETGPSLCLEYRNQPDGENILVASEALGGSPDGSGQRVFRMLQDDGDRWITLASASPWDKFNPGDPWVFVLRE